MPPKRVVVAINTSWNILNFRAGLVRRLRMEGYEVVAVAPRDEYSDRLQELGCRYIELPMNNLGTSPPQDLILLLRFWRLLRRERPVAFLGFTIKPNVYGSLAAQALGIGVLNNVSGLGTAFIRRTWLTQVVGLLYRRAFARSARVFFQNEDDRTLFVENGLVERRRTALLPGSGIDLDHFRPNPAPGRAETLFLFCGRLLRDKGVEELVEAARLVRRSYPETRIQLLGFIDVANRSAIAKAQVEEWVAEGVIEYLPAADDVRPYLADADCVVLPSYREGTPRSLLEAAAMGKPLIATDVPGCREVVEPGVNGLLCEARNASDLAAKMLAFIALPRDTKVRWGEASRRLVEQRFDEKLVLDSYVEQIRMIERGTAARS